jgi:hypothetical protein
VEYVLFEAIVAGDSDEVDDGVFFAKLIEAGTGKCRIPRSRNFLNQDRGLDLSRCDQPGEMIE